MLNCLAGRGVKIRLQFVFGHRGVPGNELAAAAANAAHGCTTPKQNSQRKLRHSWKRAKRIVGKWLESNQPRPNTLLVCASSIAWQARLVQTGPRTGVIFTVCFISRNRRVAVSALILPRHPLFKQMSIGAESAGAPTTRWHALSAPLFSLRGPQG